jgi:hypothetical protein
MKEELPETKAVALEVFTNRCYTLIRRKNLEYEKAN